jgi:acetylornithine/N-succinyldiaminopimelate aminotransferase
VLQPGDHGSTFAGGPLTATVALAVLEIVDDPELLRRVRELGATLRGRLEALDGVREIRGRGLMLGVGLEDGIDAKAVAAAALEAGVVVNVPEPGTIRLLPPLVIGSEEVEGACSILASVLRT